MDKQNAIQESVLEEAQRLIYGPRQAEYGSALVSFGRITGLWTAYLKARGFDVELVEEDAAEMLLLLKVARSVEDLNEGRSIKRDSVVDQAGYAGCLGKIADDRAEAEDEGTDEAGAWS